jgi:hypothetical protein
VLLSKFGKLEGNGKGLFDAFKAMIAARIPLLTSVSPSVDAQLRFAGCVVSSVRKLLALPLRRHANDAA